jgi:hemerythrin-like domain-containing protein
MLSVGPLMVEHRLIEKITGLIGKEATRIRSGGNVDLIVIEQMVDFIRTYTDLCHHGKEETVLFRELSRKPLTAELKKTMATLEQDHVLARQTVIKLEQAALNYKKGQQEAVAGIICQMESLAFFYPKHIEREEKKFFLPCMEYFSQPEMTLMLEEFLKLDAALVQEKYKQVYVELMKR